MLLFLFLLVYFILIFVLRSWLLWKSTGINPLTFDDGDDAHAFNGRIFKLISALEFIIVGIYAFKEEWYTYLLPFWYLESPTLVTIGWVLLIISLLFVVIAQSQMHDSWRIGIDEVNPTRLKTQGFFSISRNPVFLGIMIANIGLFLVIPNAFTLLIISLSFLSMNTQIRLEESFLENTFGEEYLNYRKRVRRWI